MTQTPKTRPPKVHTEEIFGHFSPNLTYRSYRLKSHKEDMQLAEDLYSSLVDLVPVSTIDRLKTCRQYAWFARSQLSGTIRIISNACRLRWCPVCSAGKAAFIAEQATEWLKKCRSPKMITLTLRHSPAPLEIQINEIYKAFRKLRRNKHFRKKCTSGVWFFQVCRGQDNQSWHPHIHMLVDGAYFDSGELSRLWYACTGHSFITDIKKVRDKKKAAQYVARYVARPAVLSELDQNLHQELFLAVHNRRLAGTWGSAREIRFSQVSVKDREHFVRLGRFEDVLRQSPYNRNALKILLAWKNNDTLDVDLYIQNTDEFWINKQHDPYLSLTEDLIIETFGGT